MAYNAKVVLDSITEAGDRLTTMEVTFPRFVLAEFNTHRVFSRNSASSRAIPFEKQLARIRNDPFIPIYWGKNQPGMQASVELEGAEREIAIEDWLKARDDVVGHALELYHAGVHKQTVNRLLEPWMWHTVIVTATEWSNFFALRANEMAQPEIRVIAEKMKELYNASEPHLIREGEWHMPYIQPNELTWAQEYPGEAGKISAARCARVSYLTHDGKRDLDADLMLYKRLVEGGHMSPLEHVATPHLVDNDWPRRSEPGSRVIPVSGGFCGNFCGWKQLRKFVSNEADFSLVEKG